MPTVTLPTVTLPTVTLPTVTRGLLKNRSAVDVVLLLLDKGEKGKQKK